MGSLFCIRTLRMGIMSQTLRSSSSSVGTYTFTTTVSSIADISFSEVNYSTVLDGVGEKVRVVMRKVVCSALLGQHEHLDIPQADAEITFTTSEAADSCRYSLKAMQRYLFLSYLQSQRVDEIVQSRK